MSFEKRANESPAMQLFKQKYSCLHTEEGRLKVLSFKPRPDDVFVVTPGKCGTTWMQQILHQLRSGGDMSFDNIGGIIPYIEMAHDTKVDLEAEHDYKPRCYKTHTWYPACPKGAKYVVVYREPCAAFYSYFNFFNDWLFQSGDITLHEFVTDFVLARGMPKNKMERSSYFAHLLSWWEHRHDSNVLFMFFEDMKEDLEGAVKKVAAFMGIEDEESIKKAVDMSSFEFMKEHMSTKFSLHEARYRNKACGVSDDATSLLVATGSATKGREAMDDKTKEAIHAKWLEVVGKETGFQDYNELRSAFKKENNQNL